MTHDRDSAPGPRRRLCDPAGLVRARQAARLSQRDLARPAGVSHGLIGDLEHGRRDTLTEAEAAAITEALGEGGVGLFTPDTRYLQILDRADLTARREKAGLTRLQLARTVGCSRHTIYDMETGRHKSAPRTVAVDIAAALDVSVHRLFASTVSSLSDSIRSQDEQPGRVA